ncbi:MAG: hypothetical protein MHM6MM_003963 [Cercozoa sp. M6MM]
MGNLDLRALDAAHVQYTKASRSANSISVMLIVLLVGSLAGSTIVNVQFQKLIGEKVDDDIARLQTFNSLSVHRVMSQVTYINVTLTGSARNRSDEEVSADVARYKSAKGEIDVLMDSLTDEFERLGNETAIEELKNRRTAYDIMAGYESQIIGSKDAVQTYSEIVLPYTFSIETYDTAGHPVESYLQNLLLEHVTDDAQVLETMGIVLLSLGGLVLVAFILFFEWRRRRLSILEAVLHHKARKARSKLEALVAAEEIKIKDASDEKEKSGNDFDFVGVESSYVSASSSAASQSMSMSSSSYSSASQLAIRDRVRKLRLLSTLFAVLFAVAAFVTLVLGAVQLEGEVDDADRVEATGIDLSSEPVLAYVTAQDGQMYCATGAQINYLSKAMKDNPQIMDSAEDVVIGTIAARRAYNDRFVDNLAALAAKINDASQDKNARARLKILTDDLNEVMPTVLEHQIECLNRVHAEASKHPDYLLSANASDAILAMAQDPGYVSNLKHTSARLTELREQSDQELAARRRSAQDSIKAAAAAGLACFSLLLLATVAAILARIRYDAETRVSHNSRMWTLDRIAMDEDCLEIFTKFVESQVNRENLDFLQAMRELHWRVLGLRRVDYAKIVDTYIRTDAPKEVNISARMRGGLLEAFDNDDASAEFVSDDVFRRTRAVVEEVRCLVTENSVLPFVASAEFQAFDERRQQETQRGVDILRKIDVA